MSEEQKRMLDVYLLEYEKLKEEQAQRIGFRDNMLYVTLGVFGAILSFALTGKNNYYALLVVPWVCLILGWAYLVNDEKITAIGRYIRLALVEKIKKQTASEEIESFFDWEIAHRSDKRRTRRKIEQLIIDQITFVVSGICALIAFCLLVHQLHWTILLLCLGEFLLLIVLGIEIVIYSDLAKGK